MIAKSHRQCSGAVTSHASRRASAGALAVALTATSFAMSGSAFAAPVVETPRVSGADRYETSANISAAVFAAGSATNVVVASGDSFPDGLAASALAGERNAPVLLVPATGPIPTAITAEIQRLGAANATIIGGVGAVGTDVRAELIGLGLVTNRIGGADRYETAYLVANAIRSIGTDDGVRAAFVATGEDFADALAASAPAYGGSHPVILTESSELTEAAAAALFDNSIQRVIILGGTGAVSAEVEAQIDDLGVATIRVAGADRYETAANLATRLVADADFAFDNTGVTLTTGTVFADALSGSSLAAVSGHPILFAEVGGSNATQAYVQTNATSIATLNVLGGTGAVTAERVDQLQSFATTTNQAFSVTPTGDARVLTGENQAFTVSGLTAATVDVALVPCEAVTVSPQGVATFADAETDAGGAVVGNDLADDVGNTLGVIDSIDGVAVTPATDHVNEVVVGTDGSVVFEVDATADECVAAVVFADDDLDNQINLDANNLPTSDFGVTGQRQFRVAPTVSAAVQTSVDDFDTVTFTFSEPVTVANAAAFGVFSDSTCATAVTTGASATADATGRVVVDTAAPAGAAGATVFVQVQASAVQDADAVVNPASTCLPVTLDVTPGATAAVQTAVGDLNTFSFTFTEPVNVAAVAAFDVFSDSACTTLVTEGATTTGDGSASIVVDTAAAAGAAGAAVYLQAQAGAVTDLTGNPNSAGACTAVTLDAAPAATAAVQTTALDFDTFTFSFDEVVSVAAVASFDVFSDSTCTTPVTEGATSTGDGATSIVVDTVAPAGAGGATVFLQAQAGAVTDPTGNPNPQGACTAVVLA